MFDQSSPSFPRIRHSKEGKWVIEGIEKRNFKILKARIQDFGSSHGQLKKTEEEVGKGRRGGFTF